MDRLAGGNHDPKIEALLVEYLEQSDSEAALAPEEFVRNHAWTSGQPEACDAFLRALQSVQETDALFPQAGLGLPSRIGPYRVLGEIGRGGMGRVLHVEHGERPGVGLALKLLHASMELHPRSLERFKREGEALERVRHPGVVSVLETGISGATPFLVMERIEGRGLTTVMARARERFDPSLHPLPADALELAGGGDGCDRAVRVVARLARAVAAVHREGVLHRDLKPSNVLLRENGEPVLIDFGLMRMEGTPTLTGSGDTIGTPQYMAPEQARGERVDKRSDVYALGSILFELLTLEPPRAGVDALGVLRDAGAKPLPSLRSIDRRLPRALDVILQRAANFVHAWRYANAEDLAADLEAYLEGVSIAARRPGPVQGAFRLWLTHKRAVIGAATLAFLGVVALAVGLFLRDPEAAIERHRTQAVAAWLAGETEQLEAAAGALGAYDDAREEAEFLRALAGVRELPENARDPLIRALVAGEHERRAGRYRDAAVHFRSAINISQERHRSLAPRLLLGLSGHAMGDYETARTFLSHATTFLEDTSPDIHRLLGEVYFQNDEMHGARLALMTAIQLSPEDAALQLSLARVHYALGREDKALEAVVSALDLSAGELVPEVRDVAKGLAEEGKTDAVDALFEALARGRR